MSDTPRGPDDFSRQDKLRVVNDAARPTSKLLMRRSVRLGDGP